MDAGPIPKPAPRRRVRDERGDKCNVVNIPSRSCCARGFPMLRAGWLGLAAGAGADGVRRVGVGPVALFWGHAGREAVQI